MAFRSEVVHQFNQELELGRQSNNLLKVLIILCVFDLLQDLLEFELVEEALDLLRLRLRLALAFFSTLG
jgi:hypothetical protein